MKQILYFISFIVYSILLFDTAWYGAKSANVPFFPNTRCAVYAPNCKGMLAAIQSGCSVYISGTCETDDLK